MLLKHFFQKIADFFRNIFEHLPNAARAALNVATTIVDNIKTFDTNNPLVADILTSIIPTQIDDKLKVFLRAELPIILAKMRLMQTLISVEDTTPLDDRLKAAIELIQTTDPVHSIKQLNLAALQNLLSQSIAAHAGTPISWDDQKYLGSWFYDHEHTQQISGATQAA